MRITDCTVRHTETLGEYEAGTRQIVLGLAATLGPDDTMLNLADYVKAVLQCDSDVGLMPVAPPVNQPEVFKCPWCPWTTRKGLHGVSCHIGHKHPEHRGVGPNAAG